MQVQFGTDGKRINSTKIPTLDTTVTCVLKRPCSVENPVLDLSTCNPRWSVAYIPDFHRYYFVSNISSISDHVTRYYLTVDPMASFKQRILAHSLYVVRSQSAGSNKLVDPYATHTADNPNIYQMTFPQDLPGSDPSYIGKFSQSGCYILQTAGKGTTTSIGQGVNTYLVTASSIRSLINGLFTASSYNDEGVTVAGAEKTFFNPMQYVISCRWFPIDPTVIGVGQTDTAIQFGWFSLPASSAPARLVQEPTVISNTDFSLPSLVDWTASSPEYSRYLLHVPGFGSMEIDPAFAGLPLYCHIVADLLTGGAKCEIRQQTTSGVYSTRQDPVLTSANGYWGVDVLLTQLASDTANFASNLTHNASESLYGMDFGSTAMASFSSAPFGVSEGQAAQDLMSSISTLQAVPLVGSSFETGLKNLLQPQLSVNGAVGNMSEFLGIDGKLRLTVKHYDVLEPNMNDVAGLPCHRKLLLSNLTGYTQCNNASVTIQSATIQEKLTIKKYLEGGFWIE